MSKGAVRTKSRKRGAAIEELVRTTRKPAVEGQTLEVRMDRSAIGQTQSQRATLRCLGLNRRGARAQVPDTPQNRGRIRAVAHLVSIEEA